MRLRNILSASVPFKVTVWITLGAFLLTTIGQPAAQAFQSVTPQKPSCFPFISPDRGTITQSSCFNSDTAVLLIQDLHCHPGVQKNIAALLTDLDRHSGLEHVYVEGNVGPVDSSWIEPFAVKDRKDIIETLLLSGRLTGAEYFSLTGTRTDTLLGLEDASLFRPNIARLADILRQRRYAQASLENVRHIIAALKTKWYSPAHQRLDRLITKNDNGKISGATFSRTLTTLVHKAAIDMYRYDSLKTHARLSKSSESTTSRRIPSELNAYLKSLKQRLPYSDWRALQENTENFSDTGRLFAFLARLSPNDPLFCSPAYSHLANYLKIVLLSQSLNPITFVNEQRAVIRKLHRAFSTTTTEKEIAFLNDYLNCLAGYSEAEVTYSDYLFIQESRSTFEYLWGKYADPEAISRAQAWLPRLDEFYRVNVERNDAFLASIGSSYLAGGDDYVSGAPSAWIPAAKHRIAVITGGFHTEELARILTEKKVSFAVITPQVPENKWDTRRRFEQILLENTARMSHATITETYAEALRGVPLKETVDRDIIEGKIFQDTIASKILEKTKPCLPKGSLFSYAGTNGNRDVYYYLNGNTIVSFLRGPDGMVSCSNGRISTDVRPSRLKQLAVLLLSVLVPFVLMTLFLHVSGSHVSGAFLTGFPAFAFLLTGSVQQNDSSSLSNAKKTATVKLAHLQSMVYVLWLKYVPTYKKNDNKRRNLALWIMFGASVVVARIALGGPIIDLSHILPGCINLAIAIPFFIGKFTFSNNDNIDISELLKQLNNTMLCSSNNELTKQQQRKNITELVKAAGNGSLTDTERQAAIEIFNKASHSPDPITAQQSQFMLRLLKDNNNTYLTECINNLKSKDPEIIKKALIELGLSGSFLIATFIDNANLRRHPSLEVRVYAWGADRMAIGTSHEMEMVINLILESHASKTSVLNRGEAVTELSGEISKLQEKKVHKQTIEALIYCLTDRDPEIRKTALTSLKMIVPDKERDYLTTVLKETLADKNPNVRCAALLAVQELKRHDLLPEVRKKLPLKNQWIEREDNKVVAAACCCLGTLHDTASIPTLLTLIDDRPIIIRSEVIGALNKMAREFKPVDLTAAEAALEEAVKDTAHYTVWGRAARALVSLQGSTKAEPLTVLLAQLCEDNEETCKEALEKLGNIQDEKALPYLIAYLQYRSPYIRAFTIRAIEKYAKSNPDAVTSALKNVIDNDKSAYPRATAAFALGVLRDPSLIPYLRGLLDDPELTVRVNAARSLGKLKDQGSLDKILSFLENDDWHARNGATQALDMLGDERAFLPIAERLSREDNATCRKTMIRALVNIDCDRAFPLLAGMLDDIDHSLRVLDDPDCTERALLCRAIGYTRMPGAIPVLEAQLSGGDQKVRIAAAEAMGLIGTPEAKAILIARNDPDVFVNAKIKAVLRNLKSLSRSGEQPASTDDSTLLKNEVTALKWTNLPHLLIGASTAKKVLKIINRFFPSPRSSVLSHIAPALKDARFAITSESLDEQTEQKAKDMASLGINTVYYTRLPEYLDKRGLDKLTDASDPVSIGEQVCLNVFTEIRHTDNGKAYRMIFYEPINTDYMPVTTRYAASTAIAAWLNERPAICKQHSIKPVMDILVLSGLSDGKLSALDTESMRDNLSSPLSLILDRSGNGIKTSTPLTEMRPEIRRLFDLVIDIPHCARTIVMLDRMLKSKYPQTYTKPDPLFSTTLDLQSFQGGLDRLADKRFINMLTDIGVDTVVLRSWQGRSEQQLTAALRALHFTQHGAQKIRSVAEYRLQLINDPLPEKRLEAILDTLKSIPDSLTVHNHNGDQSFDGFIIDFGSVNFALLPATGAGEIMRSLKSIHDTVVTKNSDALLGIHFSQEQISLSPREHLGYKPLTVPRQQLLFERLSYRNVVRFSSEEEIAFVPPGAWVEVTTYKTTTGGTQSSNPRFKGVKDYTAALKKLFDDRSAEIFGIDYKILERGWDMDGKDMGGVLFNFKDFIVQHLKRNLAALVLAEKRTFDGGYEASFEQSAQRADKPTRKAIKVFLTAYYGRGENDEAHDYETCGELLPLSNLSFDTIPAMPEDPTEQKEYVDYFAGFLRGKLEQYLIYKFMQNDRPFKDMSHTTLYGSLLADQYLSMEGFLGGDRISELVNHIAQLKDDAALENEVSSIENITDGEEFVYDEHTECDRLIDKMKSIETELKNGNCRIIDVYPEIYKVIRDMGDLIYRHPAGSMPRSTAFLLQFMILYAYRDEKGLFDHLEKTFAQPLIEAQKALLEAA